MKAKFFLIIKSLLCISLLGYLLFVIEFPITNQVNKTSEKTTKVQAKLNVALVNEDKGVTYNAEPIELGKKYVKKIEKDTSHAWYVVSRGIAENGLKNGSYNLMVTIPSDFSAKILELNEVAPSKADITYKVNANGNKDLELEAQKEGQSIIADLNQQLVDIYIASVLDNLYTAQTNVVKVMKNQNIRIGDYQKQVYEPAIGFKGNLSLISSKAKSSKEANDSLNTQIKESLEGYQAFGNSQTKYETTLEQLVVMREAGELTYAQFVEKLMEMEAKVQNQEVAALYQKIQQTSNQLTTEFETGGYSNLPFILSQLQTDMVTANEKIIAEKESLSKQLDEANAYVVKKLEDKYGLNEEQKEISVKKFLTTSNNDVEAEKARIYLDVLMKQFKTGEKTVADYTKNAASNLPFVSNDETFKAEWFDLISNNSGGIINAIEKINQLNQLDDAGGMIHPIKANVFTAYLLEKSYKDLLAFYEKESKTKHELQFSNKDLTGLGTFTISIPDTIEVTKIKTDGHEDNSLKVALNLNKTVAVPDVPLENEDYPIELEYTVIPDRLEKTASDNTVTMSVYLPRKEPRNQRKETSSEETSSEETSSEETSSEETSSEETSSEESSSEETSSEESSSEESSSEEITPSVPDISTNFTETKHIDLSAFTTTDYKKKIANYTKQVTQNSTMYQSAIRELTLMKTFMVKNEDDEWSDAYYSTKLEALLNMNVYRYLNDLSDNILTSNLSDYQLTLTNVIRLQDEVAKIEQKLPEVAREMTEIRAETLMLQTDITTQLKQLSGWISDFANVTTTEKGVSLVNTTTDSAIGQTQSDWAALLSESERIKATSESNHLGAQTVADIFGDFNKDVTDIEGKGESLANEATLLQADFDQQIGNNSLFVEQFSHVLENAHQNGVSNEELYQFLSNPINAKAGGSIQSVDTYKPFTLVIILFVISLFTGYVIANAKGQRRFTVTDEKQSFIYANLLITAIIVLVSLLGSVVIAQVTQRSLAIVPEQLLNWQLCITVLVVLFTLLSGYLMRQFKTGGMAILLFFLASYIFLTDAVGKGNKVSGLIELLQTTNPLLMAEKLILKSFTLEGIALADFAGALIAVMLLLILNVFVWQRRSEKEAQEDAE